jgi:glycerol uptake facilitator-like aquaporin
VKLSLCARCIAEFLGTAFLVAAVVGSGIMGEQLAGGNVAIALLANTLATGAALLALILAIHPISGAHLNPAVTLSAKLCRHISLREMLFYMLAQFSGGILGTLLAHVMFAERWYSFSQHARAGYSQMFSEFIATFGLICVIWRCSRINSPLAVPIAVGAYITAAYWFTASTSFANPAVTLARCMTDSFAGIRPLDVPGFIVAQIAGALLAIYLLNRLPKEMI